MRVTTLLILSVLLTVATVFAADKPQWWQHAEDAAHKDGYRLITDKQLAELGNPGEDYLLIDARPDYEFSAGHLPGAIDFEFDLSDTADPSEKRITNFLQLAGNDKAKPIVFYCRSFR